MEWEIDKIGADLTVFCTLHWSVVVKLSASRRRSRIQEIEMGFLHRVARLSLTDSVKIMVNWKRCGVEPLVTVVWTSGRDALPH